MRRNREFTGNVAVRRRLMVGILESTLHEKVEREEVLELLRD